MGQSFYCPFFGCWISHLRMLPNSMGECCEMSVFHKDDTHKSRSVSMESLKASMAPCSRMTCTKPFVLAFVHELLGAGG